MLNFQSWTERIWLLEIGFLKTGFVAIEYIKCTFRGFEISQLQILTYPLKVKEIIAGQLFRIEWKQILESIFITNIANAWEKNWNRNAVILKLSNFFNKRQIDSQLKTLYFLKSQ